MSAQPDRVFAEVADQFARWQETQRAKPIERAWKRLGWHAVYIAGLPDVCAVASHSMPVLPAIALPADAENAAPEVREALFKRARDKWEQGPQAEQYADWIDQWLAEVVAIIAEETP